MWEGGQRCTVSDRHAVQAAAADAGRPVMHAVSNPLKLAECQYVITDISGFVCVNGCFFHRGWCQQWHGDNEGKAWMPP